MGELTQVVFALIGLGLVIAGSGAAFAFGVAVVCRRLKWSPLNLTINVNDYRDSASTPDLHGEGG